MENRGKGELIGHTVDRVNEGVEHPRNKRKA